MKEQKRKSLMRNTGLFALASMVFTLLLFSCENYQYEIPQVDPNEDVSFQEDILKIFNNKNCAACHPSVSPPDLTPENAYEALMDGYVNTENPEESGIYTKFEGGHGGIENMNSEEAQLILNWIKQGADNN